MRRARPRVLLLGLLLCGAAAPCVAQDAQGGTPATLRDIRPDDSGSKATFWRFFEAHGRLLTRSRWKSEGGASENAFDVQDARLQIAWNPKRWFRAVVEGDAAENKKLKDAFVRLRHRRLTLRLGQFKPPVSALELESRWDIPTSERGLLREIVFDTLGWGGRRPGVELSWSKAGAWGLEGRAGLFRSSHVRGDRIGDEGFDNFNTDHALTAQALAGRLALTRRRLALGLFGEWRPVRPVPGLPYEHVWATGLDFTWSDKPKDGGRRVWADAFVGSNWQDDNAFDGQQSRFVAARLIGAWRKGGRRFGARYVEPYVSGSIVDPSMRVRADHMWEAAGGLNAGFWDRLRITLELQRRSVAENVPASLGLFVFNQWLTPPSARTALVVQLGGHF